jgi:hypothetical protein
VATKSKGISSGICIGSTKGANHGTGGLTFEKVSIADHAKFSLSDNILAFKAPNFKDGGDNIYRVNIKASKGDEVAKKTLVVTVTDDTPYMVMISAPIFSTTLIVKFLSVLWMPSLTVTVIAISPMAVMERLVLSSLPLTMLKSALVVVKVRG